MQNHRYSLGLRRYSKLLCLSTFFLVFAGSLVTSHAAGLAVPDWPLSYGMLFPPMVGGVFYEHGHRLVAATVGFMTVVFFVWTLRKETRKWVKVLAACSLLAVILQGSLGGITVLFFLPTAISVSHAILGQTFFLLTLFAAYSFSEELQSRKTSSTHAVPASPMLKTAIFFLGVVYAQLFLGALMRHTGSGLAVYDFPLMAGSIWPTFDASMLGEINSWRFDQGLDPVNLNQVIIHMLHRAGAVLVVFGALVLTRVARQHSAQNKKILGLVIVIDTLILVQILLGGIAVWTQKSPYPTSYHVITGAGILGLAALLVLRSYPFERANAEKAI